MARTKIGVVIDRPLRDRLFTHRDQERLNSLGDVTWSAQDTPLSWDEAATLLADCRVGIGSWRSPFPGPALLEACPKLELWEHTAGSVKHLFGPHLEGRRLTIASCKPALADVVAEMTLGEIILGLRGVFGNAAANRHGVTGHPADLKVLFGSAIGIVGASLIGRRVIDLLRPFGCDVLVYDPYLPQSEAMSMRVERVEDLRSLCARCDVVSLHTPDVRETVGIMGAAEFTAMRDDAIFINTARGRCVDEAALIAELSKGRLTAILDVTEPEPPAPDSPFRALPNVVYTSHVGGPACPNLGRQAVEDVAAFLSGGVPQYVVTPEMLATTA
jgi:phosphoglycerate dehydrogenase-like enzyme